MERNVIDSWKMMEDEMEKLKYNQLMVDGLWWRLRKDKKKVEKAELDNKFMADII